MSRTIAIATLSLVALVALAGCTKARTEAVVVVATDGVRVPDDVDALTLVVADNTDPTNPVFTKSFRVCGGDVTSDCFTLPLDFTLIPGPHRDHSSRVQITATRQTTPVIDDAAVFTFAEGQSLRLDFVLYANCIGNTDCASRDQACGPDAMCHPVPATPMSGEPDLSAGPADLAVGGDDLASGVDLAIPPGSTDLAVPRDLAAPRDLAQPPDFAGCVPTCAVNFCGLSNCGTPCACLGSKVCQANVCVTCGALGQPCCTGNMCNTGGVACNVGTNVCEATDGGATGGADQVLTWSKASFDPGEFYGVWAQSGGKVYAVGNYTGGGSTVWINQSPGTDPLGFAPDTTYTSMGTLYAISGRSPTDIYAAGPSGVVIHNNGTSWSDAGAGFGNTLGINGLWVGGPNDDVWALGGNVSTPGNDPYGYAHHNTAMFPTGTHWSTTTGTGRALQAAWGDGNGFVVMVADGSSVMYSTNNSSFSGVAIDATNNPLYGVFGFDPTQVYAVGGNGAIWRFNYKSSTMIFGSSPQTNLVPTTTAPLYGISGTTGHLWAVGSNNNVYHSTGDGVWTRQTNLPTPDSFTVFHGVIALGANDVYVVGSIMGGKVIIHGQ